MVGVAHVITGMNRPCHLFSFDVFVSSKQFNYAELISLSFFVSVSFFWGVKIISFILSLVIHLVGLKRMNPDKRHLTLPKNLCHKPGSNPSTKY